VIFVRDVAFLLVYYSDLLDRLPGQAESWYNSRQMRAAGPDYRARAVAEKKTPMHFQFDMSAISYPAAENAANSTSDISDLLRQLLEVQREQLAHVRNFLSAHDGMARWRAFLARWQKDFADLPEACRQAVPILERSYGKLVAELTEQVCQNGSDGLENEFALQEFLDRFGMRLSQLGTILNLVAPFAEAGTQSEST
jgi:hypothetical protein